MKKYPKASLPTGSQVDYKAKFRQHSHDLEKKRAQSVLLDYEPIALEPAHEVYSNFVVPQAPFNHQSVKSMIYWDPGAE